MRKEYFEVRTNNGFFQGTVENIPEDITTEMVKERIEVESDGEEIVIVNNGNNIHNQDIIVDWETIDYEEGLDQDLLIVDEIIEKSTGLGIEDKVIFSALSMMKEDNSLSIGEVMTKSFEKLNK